jgi:hypothetical protein
MKKYKVPALTLGIVLLFVLVLAILFSSMGRAQSAPLPLVAMVFNESDYSATQLFAGIQDACESFGFSLIYDKKPRHYGGDAQQQIQLIRQVIQDGAQAVILRPTWCEELEACLDEYAAKGVRFVLAEDCIENDYQHPNVIRLEFSFDAALEDWLQKEADVFKSAQQIVLVCCTDTYSNSQSICARLQEKIGYPEKLQILEYNLNTLSSLSLALNRQLQADEENIVIGLDHNVVSSVLRSVPKADHVYAVSSEVRLINQLRSEDFSGLITCNYRLLGYAACKLCADSAGEGQTASIPTQYIRPEDFSKISVLQSLYPLE